MEALLDKTNILDKMEREHAAFENLLAPLDGWQLTAPRVVGAWSIKDLLAHLTVWHKHLLESLQGIEAETPAADLTDEEDQAFFAAARARPLREVWAAFQASYAQVKNAIAALSDSALVDAQHCAWLAGAALQRSIACNTYEHYEEHALEIYAWLAEAN
jgi:hypothetical protein